MADDDCPTLLKRAGHYCLWLAGVLYPATERGRDDFLETEFPALAFTAARFVYDDRWRCEVAAAGSLCKVSADRALSGVRCTLNHQRVKAFSIPPTDTFAVRLGDLLRTQAQRVEAERSCGGEQLLRIGRG